MDIAVYVLIIHIVIILILILLKLLHVLKSRAVVILIAALLPLWGILMLVIKEINEYRENRKKHDIDVAHMSVESIMKSIHLDDSNDEVVPLNEAMIINDSVLRQDMMRDILYDVGNNVSVAEDDVLEKVVPLNEALVMNDSATRRALIMDVLYTNPSDYISQLIEAKKNDDTEVVHYAVTALVELQKEFDLRFQALFMDKEKLDDEVWSREYGKLLEYYISSGLLEGDGLRTQLLNYRNLLIHRIDTGNRNWTLQYKLADVNLQLGDVESLTRDVEEMKARWPRRDSTYVYRLKLAFLMKDSNSIKEIFKELEGEDVYMSSELRSLKAFWNDDYHE